MKTIICATDLTDSARPVMAVAGSLARAWGAKLDLLHVLHLPAGLPTEYLSENMIVDMRAGAAGLLDARARELEAAGVDVRARVLVGVVDEVVLKRARELRADLLVLGTHARGGTARLFLGSVAERVVLGAPCATIVVPPSPAGQLVEGAPLAGPLKIVAGIDLSPASDAVLTWLRDRLTDGRPPCDVQLVHRYWPPREHERLGLGRPDPFAADRGVVGVLTRELERHVRTSLGRDDVPLRIRPYWGAEEDPLASEAEAAGADLLVLGTSQGRHSTVLASIRHARMPVLCVPSALQDATEPRLDPVKTVLVTTDFSPLGDAAVAEAYRLLVRGGGEVVLFHAADPGSAGLDPDRRRAMENRLLALVPSGADAANIRTSTSVAADRSPGEAIVKAIHRISPDLVVMASHGRSGFRRAMRGSIAEHVTRAAVKPVLIVPPSPEATAAAGDAS